MTSLLIRVQYISCIHISLEILQIMKGKATNYTIVKQHLVVIQVGARKWDEGMTRRGCSSCKMIIMGRNSLFIKLPSCNAHSGAPAPFP